MFLHSTENSALDLNEAARFDHLYTSIMSKPAIRSFYEACYFRYRDCLERCPKSGWVIEIGSGAGFAKMVIPELIASDVIPYPHLDGIVDATSLPFEDESVRALFLLNTFHHIPNVKRFLSEANRCLKPGGRLFIIDQNVGYLSKWILKYAHHEPFNDKATTWEFETTGPLSGANGALAWIVFQRDQKHFNELFPQMKLCDYRPHSPLFYWLAGGLKDWTLIPPALIPWARKIDELLIKLNRNLGSFVDIEVQKI